jgi:hypothetical protein
VAVGKVEVCVLQLPPLEPYVKGSVRIFYRRLNSNWAGAQGSAMRRQAGSQRTGHRRFYPCGKSVSIVRTDPFIYLYVWPRRAGGFLYLGREAWSCNQAASGLFGLAT